jgi:hypothetical protein
MSFKIKLRDKSEIIVPDAAGEALRDHLLSLKKPANLEIGGDMYNSSQIVAITKTNLATGTERPQLPAGPIKNHSPNSIQLEIHRRALAQHPKDWYKYVKDKDWREKQRLSIRAEDKNRNWCDYKTGECPCE